MVEVTSQPLLLKLVTGADIFKEPETQLPEILMEQTAPGFGETWIKGILYAMTLS